MLSPDSLEWLQSNQVDIFRKKSIKKIQNVLFFCSVDSKNVFEQFNSGLCTKRFLPLLQEKRKVSQKHEDTTMHYCGSESLPSVVSFSMSSWHLKLETMNGTCSHILTGNRRFCFIIKSTTGLCSNQFWSRLEAQEHQ